MGATLAGVLGTFGRAYLAALDSDSTVVAGLNLSSFSRSERACSS